MTMTKTMTMKLFEDFEILEGFNERLDENPDETPAELSTDLALSRLLTMTLLTRFLIEPASADLWKQTVHDSQPRSSDYNRRYTRSTSRLKIEIKVEIRAA
jgi:hypothetical protein